MTQSYKINRSSVLLRNIVIFLIIILISNCTLTNNTTQLTQSPTEVVTIVPNVSNQTSYPTEIPSVTQPIIIFHTETPVPSSAAITSTTINQYLGKNIIALMGMDEPNMYLMDLDTGYRRELVLPEGYHPIDILSWSNNGCTIIINAWSEKIKLHESILRMDLRGNIIQNIVTFSESEKTRNITMSPSEEWIAFRLSEGEVIGGYDLTYKYENIEVMSTSGRDMRYRLTRGNGGRYVAWAPDNLRLAFGDYDENGVPQLYVSNLDGNEQIQLTEFTDPRVDITDIQWSPEGNLIAFAYRRQGNFTNSKPRKTDVIILSPELNNNLFRVVDNIYLVASMWWQEKDTLVVDGYEESADSFDAANESIFWIDANQGRVMNSIYASTTPGGYMEIPHPLRSSTVIGFFTGSVFYTYDVITGKFITWNKVNIGDISSSFILKNWISAPPTFEGELGCN